MRQGDGEPLKNLGFKLPAHSLLSEKSICVAYCNQGDWELREWPVPLIRSFSSSLLAHRIVLGLIKRLEPRRPLQGETILHQALTSRLASADRKRWTAQESAQPEAGILCAPPGIKLPSELQELPGSFRALALRERLLVPAGVRIWGGCIQRDPWAVPRSHGDRDHLENPSGCCTGASMAPSKVLLLPSVGQSLNIFLPISEPAPGEESHYLNINSLCGLSCNKAGVRRC